MRKIENLSDWFGKHMAIIVVVVAAAALFAPTTFLWIKTSWIVPLLGIVMFGMGLTLRAENFKLILTRPRDVIIGVLAQFIIMPVLAWLLTLVFRLPVELAVGVILVGACPGGTSSNVMTYLSKGDVPLSVTITSFSTILAPVVTPLLTLLYAGQSVDVSLMAMFISILKMVLVPIVLGVLINTFFSKFTKHITEILPLISVIAITAIIAAVVSVSSAKILASGLLVGAVVICHNLLGYAAGYGIGKITGMSTSKAKALTFEIGMQNSGLATSLAVANFAAYPLAAVPGAVFSVWHNISGAVVANILARVENKPAKECIKSDLVKEAL